jgi:hypothetical protein
MKSIPAVLVGASIFLVSQVAHADGPFDGHYVGKGERYAIAYGKGGADCAGADLEVTIKDNKITGTHSYTTGGIQKSLQEFKIIGVVDPATGIAKYAKQPVLAGNHGAKDVPGKIADNQFTTDVREDACGYIFQAVKTAETAEQLQAAVAAPASAAKGPASPTQVDFASLDLDHDGFVGSEEFVAGRHRLFLKMDKDSSGTIPGDLFVSSLPSQMPPPLKQAILKKTDSNHDGKVTAAEFDSQSQFMFGNFDSNSKGRLAESDFGPYSAKIYLGTDSPGPAGGPPAKQQAAPKGK